MDGWMDGWMDGVDLIICLAIWTLYKPRLPLTFGDFLAVPMASRNKLRSTPLPGGISKDFGGLSGGFGKPNRSPKSIFRRFVFNAFFERVLEWIPGRFWRGRNMKNSDFPKGKQRFLQNQHFRKSIEKS